VISLQKEDSLLVLVSMREAKKVLHYGIKEFQEKFSVFTYDVLGIEPQ
jgi:hypothetical protein